MSGPLPESLTTFPTTQRSLVEALNSPDTSARERAKALAAQVYRTPVITVAMHRWGLSHDDAEDLAHDFLLQAFEKDWFGRYNVARGRFRTFMRACLVAYANTRLESATRLKRGGTATHVSIDDVVLADSPDDALDQLFEREWVQSVLKTALDALRNECANCGREQSYRVFVAHDVDGADLDAPPTYATIARQFELPVSQVTNFLNWSRRRFRAHVLDTLRALTTSDAEFRAEARTLLGIDVLVEKAT